ncbi:2,3-bisphosphoglycerate-dependent phosphoglycerate mutase [Kineococcus sp. R86509]|uniref:2,3-bisphosphoglycerate-dependent phosphoglycerate mutase n=1 Tax=Kineococcus sp. R86509 TaxID=3093851 RepID=UPI0036D3C8D0
MREYAADGVAGLVLLRHGESSANAAGRFTGHWDVSLSPDGVRQAAVAAELLHHSGWRPGIVFSSPLQRATRTADLVLDVLYPTGARPEIHVDAELIERGYGVLTGMRKSRVRAEFGADLAHIWRRSLSVRPPTPSELQRTGPAVDWDGAPGQGPPAAASEISESLTDVLARIDCWLDEALYPALALRMRVLTVAHGNSLRALLMRLDHLSEEQVIELNVPTGQPLVYDVGGRGVVPGSGRYLDPKAAAVAARAVAEEGGT